MAVPYRLTPDEIKIIDLLSQGTQAKVIADVMGVTKHAVDYRVRGMMAAMNVNSAAGIVGKAFRQGIIQ
jgi:DNA-binding NarL/FixJ family response regulator